MWTVNSGANTLVRANVSGSTAPEFELLIAHAGVNANDYNGGDFFL